MFVDIVGIVCPPPPTHPHPQRQCLSSLPGEKYETNVCLVNVYYFHEKKREIQESVRNSCPEQQQQQQQTHQ